MIRLFGFAFFIVTFVAAMAQSASDPTEVTYIDLRINLDNLMNKRVKIRGGFNYLNTDRRSFLIKNGEGLVLIDMKDLQQETKNEVLELRNFSDIPLTVIGVVNLVGVQNDQPAIRAEQIEIEQAPTQNIYDSRKGIVTVPEIRVSSFRYLNSSVVMQGRFDFRETSQQTFGLWRGVDEVQVDYSQLPVDTRRQILGLQNFSNRGMRVTGILRLPTTSDVAYKLDATAIVLDPEVNESQSSAEETQKKTLDITYAQILRESERYLNKTRITKKLKEIDPKTNKVKEYNPIMKGAFEVCDPQRKVMQIWQGEDSIEVNYHDLPPDQVELIESQKPFNSIIFDITGVVRVYPKTPGRFFFEASKIVCEKGGV